LSGSEPEAQIGRTVNSFIQQHLIRKTLENRLKHYREAHGWSQGELARRLGVSRQTINAVETDKYDPSLPLALRMARLFGVAVPDLFIDHWEPEA
jgi:putative transcriptional regulator